MQHQDVFSRRKLYNDVPTCHLFVDGCGLLRFSQTDISSWIKSIPFIKIATLVEQKSFLYLSCASIDEARKLKGWLWSLIGSDEEALTNQENTNLSIRRSIETVSYGIRCQWIEELMPSAAESFEAPNELCGSSNCTVMKKTEGCSVTDNLFNLNEPWLQFNKLNCKKLSRKSGKRLTNRKVIL